MIKTRLFRVLQASSGSIPYVIVGLVNKFLQSPEYVFASEFDPKSGDHYVIVQSECALSQQELDAFLNF